MTTHNTPLNAPGYTRNDAIDAIKTLVYGLPFLASHWDLGELDDPNWIEQARDEGRDVDAVTAWVEGRRQQREADLWEDARAYIDATAALHPTLHADVKAFVEAGPSMWGHPRDLTYWPWRDTCGHAFCNAAIWIIDPAHRPAQ